MYVKSLFRPCLKDKNKNFHMYKYLFPSTLYIYIYIYIYIYVCVCVCVCVCIYMKTVGNGLLAYKGMKMEYLMRIELTTQ